jgi:tetratricopeptide (TPR) repeat protein
MKRAITSGMLFFALLLLFAGRATAQGAAVTGTMIGTDGKPMVGATITIKNDTGRTFTSKTDKNGSFVQAGVPNGVYTLTLTDPSLQQPYQQQFQQDDSAPKPWNINLKEIAAASGGGAAAEAAAKAFAGMKGHFDAGTAAMNDADTLKKQLSTATPDQKSDINSKLAADYQTAITEYTAAEQGVNQKDTGNHALIWASIGRADDGAAKWDDAVSAYQKAIDLKPTADYYSDLSTALVNQGVAQHDPAVLQQKVTDAGGACEKAVGLASAAPAAAPGGNPAATPAPAAGGGAGASATVASRCYKNIGIVLSNKGDLQQAIDPLKKASDAAPKDPQVWFLLGSAYAGSVQSKTVGDKVEYTFDPGTGPALQQCIQLDPDGALGKQCKDVMDGVNSMGAGISTTVGTAPKKKGK